MSRSNQEHSDSDGITVFRCTDTSLLILMISEVTQGSRFTSPLHSPDHRRTNAISQAANEHVAEQVKRRKPPRGVGKRKKTAKKWDDGCVYSEWL